jgi:hypothetical protein
MPKDELFKLGLLNDALQYNESLGETDTFTYKKLTQLKADLLAKYADDAPVTIAQPIRPIEMAKPERALPTSPKAIRPENVATDAQKRYLDRLVGEREVPEIGGLQTALAKYRNGSLTKRAASALIDWLRDLPLKGTNDNIRWATPKQMTSLVREGERRVILQPVAQAAVDAATQGRDVPFDIARAALDHLFSADYCKTPKASEARITQDGMYRIGERIIKVQIAVHGSGKLYAKELVGHEYTDEDGETQTKWSFEYVAGLVNELTDANRMTLEEAKAFGKLYEWCCVCGKQLTKESSIAAGIGPVCGGRV